MTSLVAPFEPMLDLVGFVYEAAQDQALWPGLGSRIALTFGASSAALVVMAEENFSVVAKTPDIDDYWGREYQAQYRRLATRRSISAKPPAVGFSGRPEPRGSAPELVEWSCATPSSDCPPSQGLATLLALPAGEVAVFGIHRPSSAEAFGSVERTRLAQFVPHLQRALWLRQRLERRSMENWRGLDHIPMAAMVVARDGRILKKNDDAAGLLRQGDGVHAVNGRVAGLTRSDTERLRQVLARAVDDPASELKAGNTLLLPRESALPLSIMVTGLPRDLGGLPSSQPAALLYIADPSSCPFACEALQSLFGLTPSEAAIARDLSTGRTTDDIAGTQGISRATVRAHLKSIYGKTGVKRQAELVALLFRSLAPLAWHPLMRLG